MSDNKTAKKKKATGKGSVYPGAAPSPDSNMAEAAIWEATHDLVEEVNQPMTPEKYLSLPPPPESLPDLTPLLILEAERVMTDPKERSLLIDSAKTYIKQAYMLSTVRNPRVLARFAIEMAYDRLYRQQISATLDSTWVRRLHLDPDFKRYRCWPGLPTSGLPILMSVHNLVRFALNTNDYADKTLPADNIVTPFAELQPTHQWSMDTMRPPIQSVRAAATVIRRNVTAKRPQILGLEVGHNTAAQALSIALQESTIYTESFVFPHRSEQKMPVEYDAVVMGIPNAATAEFVKTAINPDKPMTRWDTDRFWKMPRSLQASFLTQLVQKGIMSVKPGGVIVVIGDIQSGSHHIANAMIKNTGRFKPIPVGGNVEPVVFRYTKPPWGPYGVIPPTDRMVSAWMRIK